MNKYKFIEWCRLNIFESASFYYKVLVVLTSYFLFNRFIRKISFVYLNTDFVPLKIIEGALFGLTYLILIISVYFLRKKIPAIVFFCWFGLISVFLINEIRYAALDLNYSILKSLTSTQGFYTAKLTLPILFWGVWGVLKNNITYGATFIKHLKAFLIVNLVFIISGIIFEVSLFESYPLTGRWGYNGLLSHGTTNSGFYGMVLLGLSLKNRGDWNKIFLFSLGLFVLGHKAALLYLILIIYFVWIKDKVVKKSLFLIGLIFVFSSSYWLPKAVKYSNFWNSIYENHGALGTLLSLRNENISNVFSSSEFGLFNMFFGGVIRYPKDVEMMLFDLFIFYGVIGVLLYFLFIFKYVKEWFLAIPIIVSFFGGGLYESPMAMFVFGVIIFNNSKKHHSINDL